MLYKAYMSAAETYDEPGLPLPAYELQNWDPNDPAAPLAALAAEIGRVARLSVGIRALAIQRRDIEEQQPHTGTPIEERLMHYLENRGNMVAQELKEAPDRADTDQWTLLAQLCGIDPNASLSALLAAHEHRRYCMDIIYKARTYGFSIAETERRLGLVRSGVITMELFGYPHIDLLLELRQRFGGTNN